MFAQGFKYIPREELAPTPRPEATGGLFSGCLEQKDRLVVHIRKWWRATTDPDFLTSGASRRTSWKWLLPVPGVLAMLADAGWSKLVSLDAFVTLALFCVGCLPPSMLWSDFAIFVVHAVFYWMHCLVVVREQLFFAEDDQATPWSCQVLIVFAMASAGVHSAALVGFFAFVAGASSFLHYGLTVEQTVACVYVLLAGALAERRIAQLLQDRQGNFTYKALNSVPDKHDLYVDVGTATQPLLEALSSNGTVDLDVLVTSVEVDPLAAEPPSTIEGEPLSMVDGEPVSVLDGEPVSMVDGEPLSTVDGGAQSDGELSGQASSQSSLVDYARALVLSHLSPPGTSVRTAMADSTLSRLQPVSGWPRQRFEASQVRMPAAAAHEAPLFVERAEGAAVARRAPLFVERLESNSTSRESASQDFCQSQISSSQPSTARVSEPQMFTLPTVSEDGTSADMTRVPDGFPGPPSSPPVSPPADNAVVLRGIKLHGFRCPELNVMFIESRDTTTRVNGRETYWTASNDYFLYSSKSTGTWGVAKARRFKAVVEGASNGVAHSPEGCEVWERSHKRANSKGARGNWREWDAEIGKWVIRPNSGVEQSGRVRPFSLPEKAVQTELVLRDQGSQTEPSGPLHFEVVPDRLETSCPPDSANAPTLSIWEECGNDL